MSEKNQTTAVLEHLQNHKTITSFEAFERFGVTRLSAKIYNLRRKGHNIISNDVDTINRFGDKVTYAKYELADSVLNN